MNLAEIQRALRSGLAPLRAAPPMRLSQWANEHFYLSAESSYTEGRWRGYPFQNDLLDLIGSDAVREVTLKKSARVGYTKILLAACAYFAHHKRRNQAIWQPTDDDAKEFVKTEIDPMLRDVECMADIFPWRGMKHKNNTIEQKVFLGCNLFVRGGKSAKNYRRLSLDVATIDELDGFDRNIDNEGDAVTLAAKRVEGATFPRLIEGSTPKLKGLSAISTRFEAADIRLRWVIPCPGCNALHPLIWGGPGQKGGMKWDKGAPESARHECPHCAHRITHADYLGLWTRGRWQADDGRHYDREAGLFRNAEGARIPTPRHIGLHLWTAYSPKPGWEAIVREFLHAHAKAATGEREVMQAFVNTTLGEPYEEDPGERTSADELRARAEDWPLRTVPWDGLVLTAGVDVQDNRFEIGVWAWGRGMQAWVIDHTVLTANPADPADWDKLDQYLLSTFLHEGGQKLALDAVAIDSQGHFTHQVYNFVRLRAQRRVFAIKGEERPGRPIKGPPSKQDVNFRGRILKNGVDLWRVGTDTAKDLLFGRVRKIAAPGPGYVHFNAHLPPHWFDGFVAEARRTVKTKRGEESRWVQIDSTRNEPLDTSVYALFAAEVLDLGAYTEAMWSARERLIQPERMEARKRADAKARDNKPAGGKTPARATGSPPPRRRAPGPAGVGKSEWAKKL